MTDDDAGHSSISIGQDCVILDGATSALDLRTDRESQQSLDELSQGRAALVIAHRMTTERNANLIVVVDDHGVIEESSHQELIDRGGYCSRLHAPE